MLKWLIKLGLKFVSYQTLVETIACGIAYILEYARENASQEGWDKAKSGVKEIKNWLTLFEEVYEDDNLSEDEEKLIQDAISKCTATESIYNLLQGKQKPRTIKTPSRAEVQAKMMKVRKAK